MGFSRAKQYKENLIKFIDEQFKSDQIKSLYVATYGTNVHTLWPCPMIVNDCILDEVKTFINKEIGPSGGSNLLNGIKHVSC